jgi:hypothetical protein
MGCAMGPMSRLKLAQAVGALGGLWLMAAPAVLSYAGRPAGAQHRIIGPLLLSVALVTWSPATRAVRWATRRWEPSSWWPCPWSPT